VAIIPIVPAARREPFDDPAWTFELKFDGFRALADTTTGWMLSRRGNRMHRFEALLAQLPAGCILDGEIVALDDEGHPRFHDLMFARRPPVYVAFDVLAANGQDLCPLPLNERKAVLDRLARNACGWIAITDAVSGRGRRLFELVAALDLEGIVAKRLDDAYAPGTRWWKVLNRSYSQKEGRADLFERRLRSPGTHSARLRS
jgi:bifunctional non-homologous end joining protein LigD